MSDVFESTISQNEYENKISDLGWKIHLLENKLEEAENQIKEKIKLLREIKTRSINTWRKNELLD